MRTVAMSTRLVVVCSAIVLALPSAAPSAEVVRLLRWEEPATLLPNRGPGPSYYALVAQTSWKERRAGRFGVKVVLPGGQVENHPAGGTEGPGGSHLTVLIRSAAVRNLQPSAVVVRVSLIDENTGADLSNVLTATIADFPHPEPGGSFTDEGPYGWGTPLLGPTNEARLLPRPGPDDWTFVRIPATAEEPGFFVAATEASNAQLSARLPDYNPRAGRSDEFQLEAGSQPALGLSPARAGAYLEALGKADRSGVVYRLPTQAEWLRAARAGKSSAFWWGDEPTDPSGANFLGPEPTLATDTTAPTQTPEGKPGFVPNPWGLFHTFGNIAEWATGAGDGFVRLGGHFRTEPKSPLPEEAAEKDDTTGPDPYVGVRPVLDLDAEKGAELVRRALHGNKDLEPVEVAFDPDRATATLTGRLPEPSMRRAADRRLEALWFLAAVENRIETPKPRPGQLAQLGAVAGPARRITPLGRWYYEVPVEVRWASPLPVRGSDWYVNVYLPGCSTYRHRMIPAEPDRSGRVTVLIDRARMEAAGLPVDTPVNVALSLGDEAPTPNDPRVVSNVVPLRWRRP
jgi:hypothetical protein